MDYLLDREYQTGPGGVAFSSRRMPIVRVTLDVFTLEDEQIVWTDKSSQTNKSSDVKTGRKNFSTNKSSDIWPSGKTILPRRFVRRDEQVDDSTTLGSLSNHDVRDDDDVKFARRDWDENVAFGGKTKLKQ